MDSSCNITKSKHQSTARNSLVLEAFKNIMRECYRLLHGSLMLLGGEWPWKHRRLKSWPLVLLPVRCRPEVRSHFLRKRKKVDSRWYEISSFGILVSMPFEWHFRGGGQPLCTLIQLALDISLLLKWVQNHGRVEIIVNSFDFSRIL